MLLVQVTSPMVTEVDFRKAWRKYEEEKLDSLLTAVRSYRFLWSNDSKPLNYDPSDRPRRQDFGGTLVENGAFYITSKDILENKKCRLGGVIGIYEMNERCSREVDSIEDWNEIEKILASS
jgi:N-acylneuraminate cytidylyltransferase